MVYLVFFMFVIPICVLLHEIGHGVGVIASSNAHVHIYLGVKKNNKENFSIARIHFHLQWAYIGFVHWDRDLNKREKAFALAAGPIMSLLLALVCAIITLGLDGQLRT